VTLHNVPRIRDVRGMVDIVSELGAKVEELDATTVRITAAGLKTTDVPQALAGEIRTSLLFAGPMLARHKKVKLGLPGGDVIGRRLRLDDVPITIDGAERLKGVEHTISSDHMEVGSLIAAVAMTHGDVTIKEAVPQHLRMTRLVFQKLGVETEVRGEDIHVPGKAHYVVEPDIGGAIPHIKPQIWPGFPTDLTSIATAMATQAEGTVLIHEWMFEARMFWVDALVRMGARLVLADPHRVVVVGPSQLYGTDLRSPDIRAGMAILAATLCAKGQSVISNVEQIDRGFEDLDTRLRAIGAKIERAA